VLPTDAFGIAITSLFLATVGSAATGVVPPDPMDRRAGQLRVCGTVEVRRHWPVRSSPTPQDRRGYAQMVGAPLVLFDIAVIVFPFLPFNGRRIRDWHRGVWAVLAFVAVMLFLAVSFS
jgi:hypothetical protein